jgi:arsenate reductase
MPEKQKILFLCTGNSCRSQMAEGFVKSLKSDIYEAFSAGIEAHGLNESAVKVMKEAGVDISMQKSKTIDELGDMEFEYVVTVCDNARESCPFFPAKTRLIHKGFDDPPKLAAQEETEEERLSHYRRVRDEIRDYVESLPDSLGIKTGI